MNYVVYYEHPIHDDEPNFIDYETLEQARSSAQSHARSMPGVEVYLAQKISTFVSEVAVKET